MSIRFTDAPKQFYLGAELNPDNGDLLEDSPIYYDASDLTTHGVILGMTGSGKSGLAMTLLEEAALDGIPQIIIDPKGDITNLLLAFPEMSGDHFVEWVNPHEAKRADTDIDAYASEQAETWREGLEDWGIDPQRVKKYRRSAQFSIYTPGSDNGLPISISASFAAPDDGWRGHEEQLRKRIAGIVTAVLALIGETADPVEDPEHILLANIFEYHWRQGRDVTFEQLILDVQNPPFERLGVLDIESVITEKQRHDLAQQLNQVLASPGFQSWLVGEPVDIPSLLYTEDGHPRVTIFYTAHLNDAERQFIVTLILESLLTWMHTLSGTGGLRALLYIDEMFGLFPPHPYNPPTKEPMMRLLKQARALGIGVMMATQNAKDLDYKGLTNAGTWFIGKLQTDHDRKRVMEGLRTINPADSTFDISDLSDRIGELGLREFILHNVHNDRTPLLMKTRRTMSYLRGPLSPEEVSEMMANQKTDRQQVVAKGQRPRRMMSESDPAMRAQSGVMLDTSATTQPTFSGERQPSTLSSEPLSRENAPDDFSPVIPRLPKGVKQYYLPVDMTPTQAYRQWTRTRRGEMDDNARLLYQPSLLAQLSIAYHHTPSHSSRQVWYAFIIPDINVLARPDVNWAEYQTEPFDPNTLELRPYTQAYYGNLPQAVTTHTGFTERRDHLLDWVYDNVQLSIEHNPKLGLYRGLKETRANFLERVQNAARQQRNDELDQLAERYDRRFDALEDRADRKITRIDAEQEELESRKQEEVVSGAESVMRLVKGRLFDTISRIARLRRYSSQTDEQIEVMQEDLQRILNEIDETEAEMDREMQEVRDKWAALSRKNKVIPVTPNKSEITMSLFGIGWVPHWYLVDGAKAQVVPASAAGVAADQVAVARERQAAPIRASQRT